MRVSEFMDMAGGKAMVGQQSLCKSAIVFKPVAERTAADHLQPLGSQRVLKRAEALRDAFKEDYAIASDITDPVELAAPILDLLDHASQCASLP